MIDLSPQPATYSGEAAHSVLAGVFDRVQDTLDAGATPPDLATSMDMVRRHQRADRAEHVAAALYDVAHAAISQLVRLGALVDPRSTGR
jgi:urease accessory protein UreF